MKYIYWLSQIQDSEKLLVGNQLYILSQLLQQENPILPGFVLGKNLFHLFSRNSNNFQSWLQELSTSSFTLNPKNYSTLQSIARSSREIIDRTPFPESLATEIFQTAEQLNSNALILQPFVFSPSGRDLSSRGFWQSHTCNLNPQAIVQTIKKIYAELFNAKSLIYFQNLELTGENIHFSILVRPAINLCASGSVEIGVDYLSIRAIWGQERGLAQGDVDQDIYFVEQLQGRILSRKLGHKNYAYRLHTTDLHLPSLDCLESYIPQANTTEIAVLDQDAIANLFQLIQSILVQQPQIKYLQWIAFQEKTQSPSPLNYFFTQFSQRSLITSDLPSPEVTTSVVASPLGREALVTGIAAAPGKVVARTMVIDTSDKLPEFVPENTILVAKNITPHHLSLIKKVKGIITEIGGHNSHGAIIARELQIPAIVGAVNASKILTNGREVLLNGDDGKVYPRSVLQYLSLNDVSQPNFLPPPQSIGTKLMVNISQPESIASSLKLPVDGVGLLRSEMMLGQILAQTTQKQRKSLIWQKEFSSTLEEYLSQFVRGFAPRPVFYRSLDFADSNMGREILGNRGTYSYYKDSTLFCLELEAIAKILNGGYNNLNLILPFVRSLEEFQFCYHQIEKAGLKERTSFQVWIMAEVPSVIYLLPEYIKAGVRGIAIGTNDLTQLLLGIDRELGHFNSYGLNSNHEVVRQAISQIIAVARDNQIDCSICGQAPVEYPELIPTLVALGITSISVEPEAVNRTYNAIARAERQIILNTSKSSSK